MAASPWLHVRAKGRHGSICRRYKVHGEWRIFRWLCKDDKCMHKKANGVSDLEDDGERKEFCRETGEEEIKSRNGGDR
jgi:hypothetical protein